MRQRWAGPKIYAVGTLPTYSKRAWSSMGEQLEVHWNSSTINIIDVWADISVNHVQWHLTFAS